jgi:Uma2 family endonuclease
MTLLPRVHRFTIDDLQRIDRTGVIGDARVELEDGVIVDVAPPTVTHAFLVDMCASLLAEVGVPPTGRETSTYLRINQPVVVDDYRLYLPDFAIVRGPLERYTDRMPGGADTLLVGEVADATVDRDLREKLPAYRAAGFATIVVVDGPARAVHRTTRRADGAYDEERLVGDAEWYPGIRVSNLFPEPGR